MFLPPANNVDQLGGAANSTFPNVILPHGNVTIISLTGGCSNTNAIHIFQKEGGTTQGAYQITAAKTFYAIGYYVFTTSAALTRFIFAQSTGVPTQAGGVGSPPAGSIFYNGTGTIATAADAQTGSGHVPGTTPNANGVYYFPAPGLQFSATYYPYFVPDGTISFGIKLIGYEA